ncbi:MAG: thiamine biosynthesis protein ThiS [Chloroflexota bacterium]
MTGDRIQATVRVTVNGEPREFKSGTSVDDLVSPALGRGVAVARNGEVVHRSDWATTHVEPGDEVEIVRPIQGG